MRFSIGFMTGYCRKG